jgi:acyl carrier protein
MVDTVVKCVSEVLLVDSDRIAANSNLNELGASSMMIVELAIRLEDEFNISIPDENVMALNTVDDLVALVRCLS